jgi:hypothetical protein
MAIIRQLTEAEADLASKNDIVLQVAEATHHLASTLESASNRFWGLPVDRLLVVLNHDVPVTLETLSTNSALGTAVNASLNALNLPQFSKRAPTDVGHPDIVFNGEVFVYVEPEASELPELIVN